MQKNRGFNKRRIKSKGDYEAYVTKMKSIYGSFRALHKRQVDIKYLTDIPNMIPLLGLGYLYQLTFRDYKSGMVMVFYGVGRDQSRTVVATEVFAKILEQIGIDVKKVVLQFDGGGEFSTLKINGVEGKYLEYVKKKFLGYNLINKKEENGHVESFHRMCEEEFFDSKLVKDLGAKITPEMGLKYNKHLTDPIKAELLQELHKYIQNHNKYWFSSYGPRYAMFKKRSPLAITRDDRGDKLRYDILEQFMGAYDIDRAFVMKRKSEYPLLINSIINISSQKNPEIGHFSAGLSIYVFVWE